MTNKSTYYIRIDQASADSLEDFFIDNDIHWVMLSVDSIKDATSVLYHAEMSREEAVALNLRFHLIGCLDLHTAISSLRSKTYRCDDEPSVLT